MSKVLRVVLWSVGGLVGLAALLAGLGFYFVYTPAPEVPHLSGTLKRETMTVDGHKRVYLTYVPRGRKRGAPLVIVMHGAGLNGTVMRAETGYGFDRLADAHGFAVVYPSAWDGDWNPCNIVGQPAPIDDVKFLTAMVDKLAGDIGIDRAHVFAAGTSHGGQMAYRLALEAPSRFAAVAAVSANLPAPENFKCKPVAGRTPPVMIMNGTLDPLEPFDGGEVSLFGLFYKYGRARSAHASAEYFVRLNKIGAAPVTTWTKVAGGAQVEDVRWRGAAEVELVAIHGGGHGMPQPWHRAPRLLGPSLSEPNGPETIWNFFARQH